MKRTFIALQIEADAALADALAALKGTLNGETLRWIESSNFHLTLHFFGNTDDRQEAEIIRFLAEFSARQTSFSFQLEGLHYFKRGREPQVLFVPVVRDEKLQELVAVLRQGLAELEFPVEDKAFRPHLTLARMKAVRNKAGFFQSLQTNAACFNQKVEVREIIFYESILKPTGPVYVPIRAFEIPG